MSSLLNSEMSFTNTHRKASQLIFDMEEIIKGELEALEKFCKTDNNDVPFQRALNKAKRKFEKRRGPLLIKPLNKKKGRIILSDMEYDPISQIWKGNDKELNNFPSTPALITNLFGKNEEKVVGGMKWDPNQKEWRGNEGDLSKFKLIKPALITQLNSPLNTKTENGMVYDPVTMKWIGNENVLDAFDTMDEQNKDNTFSVGKEFNLTPFLIDKFKKSEEAHIKDLSGWFPEERILEDRDFLYSIRNMSIMKLVQTAIHGNSGSINQNSSSSSSNIDTPSDLISMISNKTKVVDETNAWDDVDFDEKPTLKLNLRVHQDSGEMGGDNMSVTSGNTNDDLMMTDGEESDWDKEMGFTSEDDTNSTNDVNLKDQSISQPITPRKVEEWPEFGDTINSISTAGKIVQLNKFKEKNQDSEDDDEDLDWSAFNTTIKSQQPPQQQQPITGTITNLKSMGTIRGLQNLEKGGSIKRVNSTINNIPSLSTLMTQFNNNSNNNNSSNNNTPLGSSGSGIIKKQSGSINGGNISDTQDDDSLFDDVEVPKDYILSLHKEVHKDDFNKLLMSGDEPHIETIKFFEDDKDVVEEDWPEVIIPSTFGTKRTNESRKSPPISKNFVEDYSEDLSLSGSRPLTLKKPTILADDPFGEDDSNDWNDISFPPNFRPSTPNQLNSSTSKNINLTPTADYNTQSRSINNTNNNKSTLNIPNSPQEHFRPVSPNSINKIFKNTHDSPQTPFKLIKRSATDPDNLK